VTEEAQQTVDLLKGKSILVTGIISEASIAYHVARVALGEGAQVVVTGYGRLSLVTRLARRLSTELPVVELDVTDEGQLSSLAARVSEHAGRLDGVVHSVANAPLATMGNGFLTAGWPDVSRALHVSTYSLQALTTAVLPLMPCGGSVVGLDFDASVAWPGYGWMGVAKAGLESCARYLARDLGRQRIRVNLVAAGPVDTLAARGIPGDGQDAAEGFTAAWARCAPLGWNPRTAEPVARTCVVLLSDWLPATTGEILHADGGVHAIGPVGGGLR
jgi:meromycolic acid enoyl-[acyl-carrier-protein] reductase